MSNSVPDDLKDIYFVLLKYSPLTLGELTIISKQKSDSISKKLSLLSERGLIRKIDDEVPLYVALLPTKIMHNQLNSLIENAMDKNKDLLTENIKLKSNLEEMSTEKSHSIEFEQLLNDVKSKQLSVTQEFNQKISDLIKKKTQSQTEILKEMSSNYVLERSQSSDKIEIISEKLNSKFSELITSINEMISDLENIGEQNKKNLRKSIQETIKSLDEGAKLVGKTINDQIRTFEDKLVTSINASITSTVEFTNSFTTELIDDYSQFKMDSGNWLNKIEENNVKILNDVLDEKIKDLDKLSQSFLSELNSTLMVTSGILEKIQSESKSWSENQFKEFSNVINNSTDDYLHQLNDTKLILDDSVSEKGKFQGYLIKFEEEIKSQLKTFVDLSVKQSQENIDLLEIFLKETQKSIKGSIEKEYSTIITERENHGEIISDFMDKAKIKIENDIITPLEQIIENVDNSFRDLSVSIKRRYDKFTTDTSSLLSSINNKILDELLHIQGSNIELLEQHEIVKKKFEETFSILISNKDKLFSESLSNNKLALDDYLNQKNYELSDLNNQLNELTEFLKSRETNLEQLLNQEILNFVDGLKAELQIIRGRMTSDFENEFSEYQKNIFEVQTQTANSIKEQKDLFLNSIDSISESISTSIQKSIDVITDSLNLVKKEFSLEVALQKDIISKTFEKINTDINELNLHVTKQYLDTSINNIKNVETTYLTKFEETLINNKAKLIEQYNINTIQIETKASNVFKKLNSFYETINESLSKINTGLNTNLTNLSHSISNDLNSFNDLSITHLDKYGEISNSLENITQKSKLDIENEMQTISEELTKVANKNVDTLDNQINEFNTNFKKIVNNSTDKISEDLNLAYSEMTEEISSNKLASENRNKDKIAQIDEISSKTFTKFNSKRKKITGQINNKKIKIQEKYELTTDEFLTSLKSEISSFMSQVNLVFDNLETNIPISKDSFLTSFKDKLNQTLNFEKLFAELNLNISTIMEDSQKNSTDDQKEFNKLVLSVKEKFLQQMESLGNEFRDTSKLRLEEIEIKINKDIEALSLKLDNKEKNDVKQLREIINTVNTSVFNDIVNDHVVGGITPFRENLIQELDTVRTLFTDSLKPSHFSELETSHHETLEELKELLINSYNYSISKLNSIQDNFSEYLNDFQQNFTNLINNNLQEMKSKEEKFISNAYKNLENISEIQNKTLNDQTQNLHQVLTDWDLLLSKIETDNDSLFKSFDKILSESDEGDFIYKNRRIQSNIDLMNYLEGIMLRTNSKIYIVVPDPDKLNLKPLLEIKKRVRIKIVIHMGKSEKRKKWVSELYKKKANIQIFDSKTESHLILCVRDNTEVIVASAEAGFIIENKNFAKYFNSVLDNIFANLPQISRKS